VGEAVEDLAHAGRGQHFDAGDPIDLLHREKIALYFFSYQRYVSRQCVVPVVAEGKLMNQLLAITNDLEAVLPAERTRLVRLCATTTGNTDIAEDLAQETLLEAWRHIHELRDPHRRAQWLSGIARNVCLRWARQRGRDLTHQAFARPDQDTTR
jgi:hypothetical protein